MAKLLRLPQVMDRVGLKKTKVYEMIKEGNFPEPIKAGRASLWSEEKVEQWINTQLCEQMAA